MESTVYLMNGIEIKLDERFRPYDDDLLRIAGLPNVVKDGFNLYCLLGDDEYSKAIRLAAFHEDISNKKARKRIIKYLLLRLGCCIAWEPGFSKEKLRFINSCYISIEGLTDFSFSLEQIIQLVNRMGFNIEYIDKNFKETDKPKFSLPIMRNQ